MCKTVFRTPNNTVKNQLISLLLKHRLSIGFFLPAGADLFSYFCTISRNSCSLEWFHSDRDVTLGTPPLMTQERSLRTDVTGPTRSLRLRAGSTPRVGSSGARVFQFGKRSSPELLMSRAAALARPAIVQPRLVHSANIPISTIQRFAFRCSSKITPKAPGPAWPVCLITPQIYCSTDYDDSRAFSHLE